MDITKTQIIAVAAVFILIVAGVAFIATGGINKENSYSDGDIVVTTPVDYNGNTAIQTYSKVPEKVVAGCNTALNMLLYLGLGDKISGIYFMEEEVPKSLEAEYKKVVDRIGEDRVLTGNISQAVLTDWEPDCVIAWVAWSDSKLGEPSYWNALNCNVWSLRTMVDMNSVEGMKLDYENFGKVFKVKDKADAFLKDFDNKASEVKKALGESNKTYAIFDDSGTDEKGYWFYNSCFMNTVLDELGAKNLFSEGGRAQTATVYDKIDKLDILIVITYNVHSFDSVMEKWIADEILATAPAIINKNVYSMNLSVSYGADPSLLDTLDALVEIL